MGEVERVPKSGRNNFHGYDYATEADIASAVRAGMAKRGVMLIPSVEKTDWTKVPTKSGEMRLCTLTVRFTLYDGDSGEELSYVVLGEGSDTGDKASYKALTGAEKYALLKIFLIPTGDDPEKDEPPARVFRPESSNGTKPAPAKAAPTSSEPPPPTDADAPPHDPRTGEVRESARQVTGPNIKSPVVKYGNSKGKRLCDLTNKDLGWYLKTATENVANEDPQWHRKNVEFLEAVQAEISRRSK